MSAKSTQTTREEYILIAKRRGIKDAHKMSNDTLIKVVNAKNIYLEKIIML